ncbi:cysteine synthase A [Clostridium cavendishii DSM 21758]|uniref:cysteine synthase n=1 Tax=Clostridium cavendishii DSM 21758 TaxID=1121302 RepID=A0A1M6NFM4_9CLOT|nr:cysteine synthase family protein [Clostridium cavendishii]SHJ94497.1 cysteine synthase A [Clostridium cavendishii DSM 21758]
MVISKNMAEKFEQLARMIGNTPMLEISLKYKGEERKVYSKIEYYNYSGSIKDRVAYNIMKNAYEVGIIKEGDRIAEATSGNTGISFAAIGAYLGNPVTIFMPDWMTKERVNIMKSFGATIRLVSKEEGGFTGSIELANTMGAKEGVFLPQQFSNPINVAAHYETTGKEILDQLSKFEKTPDAIVAGVGTGGTIMGIKKSIQEFYPNCKAFPLDPSNSPTMASGGKIIGKHRIAGIGDEFIPKIVKLDELDDIIMIDDADAINMSRKLARTLGLGVGISSGANFLGALKAQDILENKDSVVVTVFADDNKKYLSTDLMKEQTIKPGYMAQDVELIGFKTIK